MHDDIKLALTPADRGCFGIVGNVTKWNTDQGGGQRGILVKAEVGPMYLTPDWENELRVSMMFGPSVNLGDVRSLFLDHRRHNGVLTHPDREHDADWILTWSLPLTISAVGTPSIPVNVLVKDISEVRREPLFNSMTVAATISEQDYHYFYGGKLTWANVERLMTETATLTSKNWPTRSMMLTRMRFPPPRSS